ncbi:MAG: hypothetical protein U9O24_08185 [Campylobacterota bacterium]|nr:hypothetical protein [Campylobacterota bacterium]
MSNKIEVEKGIGNIETLHGNVYINSDELKSDENIVSNPFKLVHFKNLESKYSTALTCSGLGETNVLSCPFHHEYISQITTQLDLGYKCIIRGDSGSGKSLLTYQVAKKFFDNSWKIYKLNKNTINNNTQIFFPNNKSLIILDDAQTIPLNIFEEIIENANENSLVLLNWNKDTLDNELFLRSYPIIEISSSEQVKMISDFSFKNKDDIAVKLKKLGLRIDKHDWFDNIDKRIKKASQESTPWLFNYSLTEGWRQAKNDMSYLRDQNNLDLVMLVVAVYQFVTLDKGVFKEVIINELKNYNTSDVWIRKAEKILNEYCIVEDELIKHKHHLYAKEVLHIFIENDKKNKQSRDFSIDLFRRILLNKEFEFGYSSMLEFIMFNYKYCERIYQKEKFIDNLTEDIFSSSLATDTIKIRNLNTYIRFDKGTLLILKENIEVLNKWVVSCDRDTATVLQDLINTLYNEKFTTFNLTDNMLESLLKKIIDSKIIDKSRYSSVYDRLHLFSNDKQRKLCKNKLETSNFKLDLSNHHKEIEHYHFSNIISNLEWTSNQWVNECILQNIQIIADRFNKNPVKAYSYYNKILFNHFRLSAIILGYKNKKDTIIAKKLISLIKSEVIIEAFNSVKVAEMNSFATFLVFISIYDRKKIEKISSNIDFSHFKKIYNEEKELDHYHESIVRVLYNKKSKVYNSYVKYLIDKLDVLTDLLIAANPEYSLEAIKNGKKFKMRFTRDNKYNFILIFLQALDKEEENEIILKIFHDYKRSYFK